MLHALTQSRPSLHRQAVVRRRVSTSRESLSYHDTDVECGGQLLHHRRCEEYPVAVEKRGRRDGVFAKSVRLLWSSCLLLKSPVSVVITAQTLLHRFYTKKSLTEYDVKLVATACIVLACKLEEKDRKLRDVLNSVRRAVQRIEKKPRVVLPINTPEYEISKTDAKNMEMVLLREFGFFAHVSPPHPFAYTLGVHLNLSDESMKRTWTLCNDSAMTALCVRFKPQIVACGCILLAARELGLALPSRPPWYRLVDGATQENLEVIAQTI